MIIEKFEDIEAWKEARKMVNRIYKVCSVNVFKRDFSLADQMKRAAVSIMANIAEGYARNGNKEFIRFLFIAKSSAAELQSHLYVAFDQGYIDNEDFQEIYRDLDKIQRMLSNFIKYLYSTLKPNKRKEPNKLNKPDKLNKLNKPNKVV